jgi:hypothetical protein
VLQGWQRWPSPGFIAVRTSVCNTYTGQLNSSCHERAPRRSYHTINSTTPTMAAGPRYPSHLTSRRQGRPAPSRIPPLSSLGARYPPLACSTRAPGKLEYSLHKIPSAHPHACTPPSPWSCHSYSYCTHTYVPGLFRQVIPFRHAAGSSIEPPAYRRHPVSDSQPMDDGLFFPFLPSAH